MYMFARREEQANDLLSPGEIVFLTRGVTICYDGLYGFVGVIGWLYAVFIPIHPPSPNPPNNKPTYTHT